MKSQNRSSGKRKIRVAVAMSGGVDSGVAAALLVKEGYEVAGFHLHLWVENVGGEKCENKCCSTESLEAARKTAALLKIPFYTLNLEKIFKKRVVDYFLKEFSLGRTPNPCVMCNRYIKFGELLSYIRKLGYDFLATGHYARIGFRSPASDFFGFRFPRDKTLRFNPQSSSLVREALKNRVGSLLQAYDPQKDQSYFLYNLTQGQLAHVLFPVGTYTKDKVRKMAREWKLPVAHRPESQEICFFPETDYRPFLKRQIPQNIKPGEVVDVEGRVIGEHDGLPLYTIGQRHGFRVKPSAISHQPSAILPLYVVGMDVRKNRLVVGWGKEAERKEFEVKDVNWVNPAGVALSGKPLRCSVRIRHQGEFHPCQLITHNSELITVVLDEPARAITPGQAAVFYFRLQNTVQLAGRMNSSKKTNLPSLRGYRAACCAVVHLPRVRRKADLRGQKEELLGGGIISQSS